MARRLAFVTSNKGKLLEAEHHLAPLGWQVEQFLVDGKAPELIEPQCETLEEVAMSKISQAISILGAEGDDLQAVLVEDAGLFLQAFPGFPGVYSSSVFKSLGCEGILRLMQDERGAHFEAVAVLWDGQTTHIGRGICQGKIAMNAAHGEGFGFDPIFIPDDLEDGTSTAGQPFGAVSMEIKQKFSHRSKALDDLIQNLAN